MNPSKDESPFSTPGARLAARRIELGLELREVARRTRIRTSVLERLEMDDLGSFPHPSYARLFLLDYCKFLNLPVTEIRDWLPETGHCSTEGLQYLDNLETGDDAVLRRPIRSPKEDRVATPVLGALVRLAALVVLLAVAAGAWLLQANLDRLSLSNQSEGESFFSGPGESLSDLMATVATRPSPLAFVPVDLQNSDLTPEDAFLLQESFSDLQGAATEVPASNHSSEALSDADHDLLASIVEEPPVVVIYGEGPSEIMEEGLPLEVPAAALSPETAFQAGILPAAAIPLRVSSGLADPSVSDRVALP
jgi:transcriptional regulator with XRE-family HTH domain